MINIYLKENENFEDLQYQNLYIIQNKNHYRFTSDAVLLANSVKAKKTDTIVDFCSGSGVVGILAQAKTSAANLVLVELQEYLADMSKRTLLQNNLQDKVKVINDSVQNIGNHLENNSVDVVCCNPPYKINGASIKNQNYEIAICKHEITITLDEIIKNASKILKNTGAFYIVNKEDRLTDMLYIMRLYKLEPKNIYIKPSAKGSNIVVVEAKKGGKSGVKVHIVK